MSDIIIQKPLDLMQKLPGGYSPNLFEVKMFGEDLSALAINAADTAWKATNAPTSLLCSKVLFPGLTLDYENRHKVFREVFLKEIKIADEIAITWYETHDLAVRRYHQEWFSRFYNRKTDQYVTGLAGKRRTATIIIQNPPDATGAYSQTPAHTFKLEGLMPMGITDISLDWNWGGEAPYVTMKYKINKIKYWRGADTGAEGLMVL